MLRRSPFSPSTFGSLVLAAALLAAPLALGAPRALAAQAAPTGAALQASGAHEVGRDQVEVDFFTAAGVRLTEVGGVRTVDRNGQIYLPYVGDVRVTGLDAAGLRARVIERFGELYQNPVVDVRIRIRVNITGSVRQPGAYYVDPTSSLVDALAQAGGAGSEIDLGVVGGASDPTRIRLVRDGQTQILNLSPDQASPLVLNMPAQSGDWLHVPPRARSRTRDNITFAASFVGLLTSVASLVILATR